MKRFPSSACVFIWAVLTAALPALGQYGLYGSPEVVPLPETGSEAVPCSGYAVPAFAPNPQLEVAAPSASARPDTAQANEPRSDGSRQAAAGPAGAAAPSHRMPRGPIWARSRPMVGAYDARQRDQGEQAAANQTPPEPPNIPAPAAPSPGDQQNEEPASHPTTSGARENTGDSPVVDYSMPAPACGTLTDAVDGCGETCGGYGYGQSGGADHSADRGYTCSSCGGAGGPGLIDTCGRLLGYRRNPCGPSPWYGSITGLYLGRNDANRIWTSFENNAEENQLTHTNDADVSWEPGFEITFGRRFGCGGQGPWAIEASYFHIENFEGFHSTVHANGVSTPLSFDNINFAGDPANNFFMGSEEHRLWRENEIHNVEVSLVRTRMLVGRHVPWDFEWEVGVRYFRFDENLRFGALGQGSPGWHVAEDTAFLDEDVTNNLIGGQVGFDAGWYFHPSWRLFVGPKFGVYNNHIEQRANLHLGDGTGATVTAPPGAAFPVDSEDDEIAFLTQIDTGLDWQITQRFSAQVGYRLIVATGMALADHQLQHYINDTPEFAHVDNNGELVLHGAFARATFNY